MAPLEDLHRALGQHGLVVVGVLRGGRNPQQKLRLYRQQYGVTFPLLHGQLYGYRSYPGSPTVTILDRSGRIAAARAGQCVWSSEPVRTMLEALLAAPVATFRTAP